LAIDRTQLTRAAEDAARRGDMARAANIYRQLLELSPDDLGLLQRLGDALARSGQEGDARQVFVQLGRAYAGHGHRGRALAALRRAARTGGPDARVLAELAGLALDAGMPGDAHEPLLEATRLFAQAGAHEDAAALLEKGAAALPRDVGLRDARAQVAEAAGRSQEAARWRVEAGIARAGLGDVEGALQSFAAALAAEPSQLSALRQLPEILRVLRGIEPARLPERWPGLAGAPAAGWLVLRAFHLSRAGQGRAALGALRGLRELRPIPPIVALWSGQVLVEQQELGAAERMAQIALGALGGRPEHQRALVDLLSGVVAHDPRRQWAADELERLAGDTAAPARAAPSASPPQAPAPPAPAEPRPAEPAPAAEPSLLPDGVRARLFEVDALTSHGLFDTAGRALESIPPDWRDHPEAVRRREDLERRRQPPTQAPAPAPEIRGGDIGAEGASSPPEGSDEAEWVLLLDEEDGETAPSPDADTAPEPTAHGAPAPDLGTTIQSAMADSDAETAYQMAIGLLEMELPEQALPLLEQALEHPSRALDAALALIDLRRRGGQPREALETGLKALASPGEAPAALAGEVLSRLVDLALELGDLRRAQDLLDRLVQLDPAHPRLGALRAAVQASGL
jgi:tetratricopeptide (TPR) repeat protein